jgi:Rrf2 family protein
MASQPDGRILTKQGIAETEAVPSAYVQQLMIPLRAAGLVTSHRGKVGGFTLAQTAESITVADVLRASEGPMTLAPCLGNKRCEREPRCPTRPVWIRAVELLDDFFGAITIAELATAGRATFHGRWNTSSGRDNGLGKVIRQLLSKITWSVMIFEETRCNIRRRSTEEGVERTGDGGMK